MTDFFPSGKKLIWCIKSLADSMGTAYNFNMKACLVAYTIGLQFGNLKICISIPETVGSIQLTSATARNVG